MSAEALNIYMIGFAEVIMQLWFSRGFLRSGVSAKRYIPFAIITGAAINLIPVGDLARSVIFVLLLYIAGRLVMRSDNRSAAICAVTSAVIMQLCFGVCACIGEILLDHAYDPALVPFIAFAGNILPLVLSYLCYKAITSKMTAYAGAQNSPVAVVFPLILIFGLDLYINNFIYGNTIDMGAPKSAGVQIGLLTVRVLCLASVMCIIWAYNKLIMSQLAEREYQLNKQYAEKAEELYSKTTSFQHDFKNHLLVINGLISKKEYEKAKQYTDELYGQKAEMSFGYATGRPVIDILLDEKLSALTDTDISCDLKIPGDFEINDIDLCIIISNAVDNAVSAVNKLFVNKYISLSCKRNADILLFEIKNSYDEQKFTDGTGLSNIRATAKKYNGKVIISTDNNIFDLKILFNISRH